MVASSRHEQALLISDGTAPALGLVRIYGYTTAFCMAIAVLLWTLDASQPFIELLTVSCFIGWCVASASMLLEPRLEGLISPYLVPVPVTLVGLVAALLLAAAVLGKPVLFFVEALDNWVLGIFFGLVGLQLMGTHGRTQSLRTALAQANSERLQQEKLRLETELRLLQAQIEPHFLFNALSNVASMIRDKPEQAEAMITDLTTLLRASLERTRSAHTTVADELALVRAYLDIQHHRMGNRLSYRIDLPPALADLPLPPLLLQPLVENAVRHGIEPCEHGGHIDIELQRLGETLSIAVRDSGKGLGAADASAEVLTGSGGGIGISNVLGRLDALYHGAAELAFTDNPPHGVAVTLSLPMPHAHRPAG